jgi:hypothetical protein
LNAARALANSEPTGAALAGMAVGNFELLMSSWFAYSMFFAAKMRKMRKQVKFSGLLSSVFCLQVFKSSV